MRKTTIVPAVFVLALLTSLLGGVQTATAQRTSGGSAFPLASGIAITSPVNMTYSSNLLILNVSVRSMLSPDIYRFEMVYSVDGQNNATIPLTATFVPVEATATYPDGTTATVTSIVGSYYLIAGCIPLPELAEGPHNITVYANYVRINNINTNWPALILDNNTVYFTINNGIPPIISNMSPENKTYSQNNFTLNFTVNEPVSQTTYSLDGAENVTIVGNTTLTCLVNGSHNVTVYATDEAGNVGVSETISFTVTVPEPFPSTLLVKSASGASAIFVAVGLAVYLKKRKH